MEAECRVSVLALCFSYFCFSCLTPALYFKPLFGERELMRKEGKMGSKTALTLLPSSSLVEDVQTLPLIGRINGNLSRQPEGTSVLLQQCALVAASVLLPLALPLSPALPGWRPQQAGFFEDSALGWLWASPCPRPTKRCKCSSCQTQCLTPSLNQALGYIQESQENPNPYPPKGSFSRTVTSASFFIYSFINLLKWALYDFFLLTDPHGK